MIAWSPQMHMPLSRNVDVESTAAGVCRPRGLIQPQLSSVFNFNARVLLPNSQSKSLKDSGIVLACETTIWTAYELYLPSLRHNAILGTKLSNSCTSCMHVAAYLEARFATHFGLIPP